MRERKLINDNWYFIKSDLDSAKELLFDHSSWQRVQLPHDYSIDTAFQKHETSGRRGGFLGTGVGFYRKSLQVSKEMLQKKVIIQFDGVFMNSTLWINGKLVGNRPYGYVSFYYDISSYLVEGANILAVRIDCEKQTQSRWYNGCGIYRNVWLETINPIHVAQWGTTISTQVEDSKATISYNIEIENETKKEETLQLCHTIFTKAGEKVLEQLQDASIKTKETVKSSFVLENPSLWSVSNPNLYVLETVIIKDGAEIDRYSSDFGICTMEFRPNEGFFLNGQHTLLKGVCLHHDGGVVGSAVPLTVLKKRLSLLKEMGCNAIRTAHNPFSPEFYDLCNSMGFLVMNEIFDGWETKKADFDYHLYFEQWHQKDIEDVVKRDRNHPCIFSWSIGNEVTGMTTATTKKLIDLVRQYDTSRAITCGVQGVGENSDDNRALLDVAGYNDGGGACFAYERDHEKRPNQLMIATEAPHTYQTRGVYRTQTWWRDKNQPRIEIENLIDEEIFVEDGAGYYSSYDNSGVRTCCRDSWGIAERLPYLCGEFRWSGIDYYGESHGWPQRKSESGIIDCANFPKDSYYLYQSMWVPVEEKPMVHILPHWSHNTFTEKTIVPVWVYTNAEKAELFLNGKSLGAQEKNGAKHLQWNVPYVKGSLKAIAYQGNAIVAEKSVHTAGEGKNICLTSDTKNPVFDGISTVQVDCHIADEHGVMLPKANNTIHFFVEGGAHIVGTENGDPQDLTKIQSLTRKLFKGLCGVTLRLQKEEATQLLAATVIGDKLFKESTKLSIQVQNLTIYGKEVTENYSIYYRLDGVQASNKDTPFTEAISITNTTEISVAVYRNEEMIFNFQDIFYKGEREPYIDLAHGNKQLNLDVPPGPFATQLEGQWTDGNFAVHFKPDGKLVRLVGGDIEQFLGHWWYDFPIDYLEAQEYAGTGEIWFDSGEKEPISLVTQEGKELKVDNSLGAIATAYGFSKEIIFKKI